MGPRSEFAVANAGVRRWVTPTGVVLVAILAASLFLLVAGRNLWFFGDEWAFIIGRRELWGNGSYIEYLFDPHNEHLTTIPVLANSVLFKAFGVDSYLPYLTLVVAAHAAVSLLLYRLLERCAIDPWLAAAAAAVFAFFGSGAENLVWGFQIGFVGAMAFGLGQLLLADHPGGVGRRDLAAVALGCLAVLTHGPAVTMVAAVGMLMVLRRRWSAAALQVCVPAAIYAMWYVTYGASRSQRLPSNLSRIVAYVNAGLEATLDAVTQLPPAGMAVGIALVIGAGTGRFGSMDRIAPAVALAFGCLLFFSINGFGRAALGAEQAQASRYVYIGGLLLWPLAMLGLESVRGDRHALRSVAMLFVVWSFVGNVSAYFEARDYRLSLLAESRPRIEAAALYALLPSVDPTMQPEPMFNPDVTMGGLARLIRSGDLGVDADGISLVAAQEAALDFGVSIDEAPASSEVGIETVLAGTATGIDGECVVLRASAKPPAVALRVPELGGTVSVRADGTVIRLSVGPERFPDQPTRDVQVVRDGDLNLTFDLVEGGPILEFPDSSSVQLCNVGG